MVPSLVAQACNHGDPLARPRLIWDVLWVKASLKVGFRGRVIKLSVSACLAIIKTENIKGT